jgi:ribosomal-protein-alanine N-acetyltransferase
VRALLRPAVEGDLGRVAEIEKSCFADPWTKGAFRSLLTGLPAIFQVAVFPPDDVIRGYAIAFSVGEDAEILNLAVDPAFRGQGLAGKMLDAVLIELAARGARTAFLEVRESNEAARALYRSRGFVEIGNRKRYYRRPVEDALVLRKMLEVPERDERRTRSTFADH